LKYILGDIFFLVRIDLGMKGGALIFKVVAGGGGGINPGMSLKYALKLSS
jgi:hypothetical protein